jgi:hypothetical protein
MATEVLLSLILVNSVYRMMRKTMLSLLQNPATLCQGYPNIFEADSIISQMFRKIIPLNNKQASGYFLLISLYCFINGVSLTSLSLDANLYYLINVKM